MRTERQETSEGRTLHIDAVTKTLASAGGTRVADTGPSSAMGTRASVLRGAQGREVPFAKSAMCWSRTFKGVVCRRRTRREMWTTRAKATQS